MVTKVLLSKYDEEPAFLCAIKWLQYENGIPIGMADYDHILDTRLYEVEYFDGCNASLSTKFIT